jgi:hypothetical protein
MTKWFYRTDEKREVGPVPSSQLLELIRNGAIDGETEVRKDDSPWVPARLVNGLWKAAGTPSVAFKCPFCSSVIERPPTKCEACERTVAKSVGQLVQHARPKEKAETWAKSEPIPTKPKAPPLQ